MDFEPDFWDEEQLGLIRRFENMLKDNRVEYFDVNEFVDIIDYYVDFYQSSQASKAIDMALKFHPYSTEILIKKAQSLLLKNDLNKALEVIKLARSLEETNPEVYICWGVYYLKRGQQSQAKKQFSTAIELAEQDEIFDVYLVIARAYKSENNLQQAIIYIVELLEKEPGNPELVFELANCYHESGDYDEEIKLYDDVLASDPFEELIWYQKGDAHWELGEIGKAIESFEFAIAIDPRFTLPVVDLADLYIEQGMYQKAIDVLTEYIRYDSELATVYCFLAECYLKLGDYNKSLETYEKALAIDPEYGATWFGIGEVYYNEHQYHESYLYFRKALKLNPTNGAYWRYLGAVQLELGFDKHGIRSFERATHYSPNDKESWIMRFITAYFGQGIESAYEIACQAIEIFQTEAEFYFHKTACLIEKNQIAAAEQSFAQALTLNPGAFDNFAIFYPKIYSFGNFKKLINTFVRNDSDDFSII